MRLKKSEMYVVNGRKGIYVLSIEDGKYHCFHMNDTLKYEYFPINKIDYIVKVQHKSIFCHDIYRCECGFETTNEADFSEHIEEGAHHG